MKKFLMFVAFAAMCVTANAQEVKMTSYADEDMVFQYPADWKPTEIPARMSHSKARTV